MGVAKEKVRALGTGKTYQKIRLYFQLFYLKLTFSDCKFWLKFQLNNEINYIHYGKKKVLSNITTMNLISSNLIKWKYLKNKTISHRKKKKKKYSTLTLLELINDKFNSQLGYYTVNNYVKKIEKQFFGGPNHEFQKLI